MVIAVGACYPVWLRRLQQAGIVSAGFELDLMLEEGFAISKAQRLAHPERELTPEEVARMQGWLVRREAGEPLRAYDRGGLMAELLDGALQPERMAPQRARRSYALANQRSPCIHFPSVFLGNHESIASYMRALRLPASTL